MARKSLKTRKSPKTFPKVRKLAFKTFQVPMLEELCAFKKTTRARASRRQDIPKGFQVRIARGALRAVVGATASSAVVRPGMIKWTYC